MTVQKEINRRLAHNGLVDRRHYPQLAGAIDWALHTSRLTAVLPGVYAVPEIAQLPDTRIRAVCLRHPDAVLLTAAAARMSFWPAAPLTQITVAVRSPLAANGFAFTRRRIPPDLVVEQRGLRFTHLADHGRSRESSNRRIRSGLPMRFPVSRCERGRPPCPGSGRHRLRTLRVWPAIAATRRVGVKRG